MNLFTAMRQQAADYQRVLNALMRTRDEMDAQDRVWGQQNHPMLPANGFQWMLQGEYISQANEWKRTNDSRADRGILAWDGILLEEVYEALSESDPRACQTELVQVAAVALQAALAIERKIADPYVEAMRDAAQRLAEVTTVPDYVIWDYATDD